MEKAGESGRDIRDQKASQESRKLVTDAYVAFELGDSLEESTSSTSFVFSFSPAIFSSSATVHRFLHIFYPGFFIPETLGIPSLGNCTTDTTKRPFTR
jgi:hypothetical protein